MLYTINPFAPFFDAKISLSEKKTISSGVSPPLSAKTILFFTSIPSKSFSLLYFPNTISVDIGSEIVSVPNIGKTWNCVSPTSNVETILESRLLYVAPTVIALGFFAGLPMVLLSGPLFPAAATTTIP